MSSIFYNMQEDSPSVFRRNLFIFYVLMINIWTAALEVLTLYSKRKIVEKHVRYALYHPAWRPSPQLQWISRLNSSTLSALT